MSAKVAEQLEQEAPVTFECIETIIKKQLADSNRKYIDRIKKLEQALNIKNNNMRQQSKNYKESIIAM